MLTNEKSNNGEEKEAGGDQDKIGQGFTKQAPIQSTSSENIKSAEKSTESVPLPIPPAPTKEVKPTEGLPERETIHPHTKDFGVGVKPQKKTKKKNQRKIETPKEKIVTIDGKKILKVPSGFEIMTKEGWKPIMMRVDKITNR